MAKVQNKPKTPAKTPPRTASRAAQGAGGRTVERRKERGRERRRQQLITGGIIAVAVVVLLVVVVLIVNAPAEATIPEGALTRYDGVPQTRTDEGYPRLGDSNAPVQVAEYSSFDCPHCRDFHDEAMNQIIDRVRTGKVAFTFVPLYGFGSIANGQGAAAAAVCAAEQGKFWPFHDALFNWQGVYANQAFTNNRITAGVDAFALDKGAYSSCISSSEPSDVLNAARSQASALLNFAGTPTITINGVVPLDSEQQPISDSSQVLARIDAEMARVAAPQPTTQPVVVATSEPTPETTEQAAVATAEATPETTPAS